MEEKFFESLFIDVKFKNKTNTFGCIYRAPCNDIISHSSFLDILNNTLKCIKKRDCFLLGDFNYNILDCEKPQITDFVDQMFDNGFAPLINKPTRISKNNATLLDHIWSNSLVSMKINCDVLTHCISDHLPVMMCTSISKISHQNVQQCRHFTDQNPTIRWLFNRLVCLIILLLCIYLFCLFHLLQGVKKVLDRFLNLM